MKKSAEPKKNLSPAVIFILLGIALAALLFVGLPFHKENKARQQKALDDIKEYERSIERRMVECAESGGVPIRTMEGVKCVYPKK